MAYKEIPTIDLFAGPGGLGEGFSRYGEREDASSNFDLRLSVEKDPVAFRTLRLRALYRLLRATSGGEDAYWRYVEQADRKNRGAVAIKRELEQPFLEELDREVPCPLELGSDNRQEIDERIRRSLPEDGRPWVLLGGPPCQAYSLVGRSRMQGTRTDFHEDPRHFLYREYLHVIAKFQPAIFVMENVKGILSSRVGPAGEGIFPMILRDLADPAVVADGKGTSKAPRYRIHSFMRSVDNDADSAQGQFDFDDTPSPSQFIIRAENFGIPQSRHRVILLGVREDLAVSGSLPGLDSRLEVDDPTVDDAIRDLAPLRSQLSKRKDKGSDTLSWAKAIEAGLQPVLREIGRTSADDLYPALVKEVDAFTRAWSSPRRNPRRRKPSAWLTDHANWYRTKSDRAPLNHEPRGHITEDLGRYFFAAAFARKHRRSPKLAEFPPALLPAHRNVSEAVAGRMFADRFRVQLAGVPSTTVTSHISKDGHYYIHPDVVQCRSLTVREAARLQTFPDDYFFEGPRTAQYHQVGNAVPPMLACQLAAVVAQILENVT